MLIRGIVAAVAASLAWMLLHLLAMHIRPARNRFNAILAGYLLSLPLVFLLYRWLPVPAEADPGPFGLGLFHAYLLHLLLYFQCVEFFYHIERSVTVRFLVMMLQAPNRTVHPADIQKDYSLEDMITGRLAALEENGFIESREGRWYNRRKGLLVTLATVFLLWFFRSKPQSERL